MPDDIWGPWIEHDGRGCPVAGRLVIVERRNGEITQPFIAYSRLLSALTGSVMAAKPGDEFRPSTWIWFGERAGPVPAQIIRYRVKKPKGLTILENLIAEIPEEVAG